MATGRPIRVTQVVFDLDGGGMETLVGEMAAHWRGSAVTMSIITLGGRVGRIGATVLPLVESYHVLRPLPGLSMLAPAGLVRAIRATRPDVVHLHSGAWYKGALAARLAGVARVIYTEHGREHHDPALVRWLDRRASRWTDRVVAVSDRLNGYLVKTVGISTDRVVTVANGVDTAAFSPGPPSDALRTALAIPADALVLGSVGRLEPVKAYGRLIEAYAHLRQRDFGRPLVLVLFGEGSDRPDLEAVVDRLGVHDGVRLPGWMERPADGYRLMDVFAMTSRSEGMSVSLMEAMACGICPMVTDVGSNAAVLGPLAGTQVVTSQATEAYVEAVARLLGNAEQRRAVGSRAREHALAAHNLSRMLSDYERLYRGRP